MWKCLVHTYLVCQNLLPERSTEIQSLQHWVTVAGVPKLEKMDKEGGKHDCESESVHISIYLDLCITPPPHTQKKGKKSGLIWSMAKFELTKINTKKGKTKNLKPFGPEHLFCALLIQSLNILKIQVCHFLRSLLEAGLRLISLQVSRPCRTMTF